LGAFVAEPGDNETRSNESRDSLLRDLAHELRDTLSPLAASLDLMRLRKFDPEVSATVAQRLERALQRAFVTLDAFVLAEQCEQGTVELETAAVSPSDILQRAAARLDAELRERIAFAPGTLATPIYADLRRTAEVVHALAQHAHALAMPGSVVTVRAQGDESEPEIRVSCRIDPQGMPGEDLFLTYRPGSRARMALRTARCIMELQHGSLEAAARANGELDFVLRFAHGEKRGTTAAGRSEPSVVDKVAHRASTHLVIVDDSAEVRRAYREALLPLGYTVTEAADAEQALGALERAVPHVALIDIHLPRTNGYRLAQAIRARTGSAVRLVMLSGMALDATTRRLSREAGFDDCLDKMAGPLALHRLLQQQRPAG
jgi:CheY-like chemotaxis protein